MLLEGVPDQVGSLVYIELVHDVGSVPFDGPAASGDYINANLTFQHGEEVLSLEIMLMAPMSCRISSAAIV